MAPESHRPLVSFSLQAFESQLLDLVSLSEVLMILVCELYQQQAGLQGTESHYKGTCKNLGTRHREQASQEGHKRPNIVWLNKGTGTCSREGCGLWEADGRWHTAVLRCR